MRTSSYLDRSGASRFTINSFDQDPPFTIQYLDNGDIALSERAAWLDLPYEPATDTHVWFSIRSMQITETALPRMSLEG